MNQKKHDKVWILVQSLDHNKRVRLPSGDLTPAFEYPAQAFNYCKGKHINHCDIINV
jgi:hypothetical protein